MKRTRPDDDNEKEPNPVPAKRARKRALVVRPSGVKAAPVRATELFSADLWRYHMFPALVEVNANMHTFLLVSRWFYKTLPTIMTRIPQCWLDSGFLDQRMRLRWKCVEEITLGIAQKFKPVRQWRRLRRVTFTGYSAPFTLGAAITRLPLALDELVIGPIARTHHFRHMYQTPTLQLLRMGMQGNIYRFNEKDVLKSIKHLIWDHFTNTRRIEASLCSTRIPSWPSEQRSALKSFRKLLRFFLDVDNYRKALEQLTLYHQPGRLADMLADESVRPEDLPNAEHWTWCLTQDKKWDKLVIERTREPEDEEKKS